MAGIFSITNRFPTLFNNEAENAEDKDVQQGEEGDTNEIDSRDKKVGKRDTGASKGTAINYYWERVIAQICEKYCTPKHEVFDFNVIEFLNDATFCKVEILEYNRRQREMIAKARKGRK